MKTKFWLLVITPAILLLGVSLAYAACESVATADFQGQVCTEPGKETRNGIWLNEDGGTFSGNVVIATVSRPQEQSTQITKNGVLATPTFNGRLEYAKTSHWMAGNVSGDINETRTGKERLADGGVFAGSIKTYKQYHGHADSTVRFARLELTKKGTLATPTFDGTLEYVEMSVGPGDFVQSSEVKTGKESLADGGIFEGSIFKQRFYGGVVLFVKQGTLTTPTFSGKLVHVESGDTYRETITGKWRVSPTLILNGTITTVRNANGTYTVTDNRK